MNKRGMLSRLISGLLTILIGCSLIPVIAREVKESAATAATPMQATILKLVPGFFALGILGIGAGMTFMQLKEAGVILNNETDEPESDDEAKGKKPKPAERKSKQPKRKKHKHGMLARSAIFIAKVLPGGARESGGAKK